MKMEAVEIPLTQGKVTWIDRASLTIACFRCGKQLQAHTWYAVHIKNKIVPDVWYASTNCYFSGPPHYHRTTRLHQMVMGTVGIDHIDVNGLNNRASNLRVADHSENAANRVAQSKSGYKGVVKHNSGWRADVGVRGSNRYLGMYDTPEDAARAYDAAAREAFGERARLNFPDQ